MSLQQEIKEGIKDAMRAKEEVKLSVLRSLSAAFTNELVAKGRKPQDELSDEEVLAVITRASKQRKDSIDQFVKGGRPELAESEQAELAVIEAYLPTLMSEEEIKTVVLAKKSEMNVTDKSQLGMFVGAVMKDLKGKADGALVKKVIDESFN
jgi:uncharacterized protein YqeY